MITLATLTLALAPAFASQDPNLTTATFESKDGHKVTADLYKPHSDPEAPLIVLFHQARWSRGEYRPIAPRLYEMGFNCFAVDLRSGGTIKSVTNDTFTTAIAAGKQTTFVDAYQDIIASLEFARERYTKGPIIAWGSSYSASLVLRAAAEKPDLVAGVLSFAPGEYFEQLGKPATWIQDAAKDIQCPVFITSAKKEKPNWWAIYEAIPSKDKAYYLPETAGNHGSRALWKEFKDSKGYWKAVEEFLGAHFVSKQEAGGESSGG